MHAGVRRVAGVSVDERGGAADGADGAGLSRSGDGPGTPAAWLPTAVIAAVGLVAAFAVAQLTQVRAAGGVLLVAAAAWCVLRERRRTSWWRLAVVVLAGVVCFAAAHRLDDLLGAWPAVLAAAAVLGGTTLALVDLPARRRRRAELTTPSGAVGR